MLEFAREFLLTSTTRILDVGGTPDNWQLIDVRPDITLLNTDPKPPFHVPDGMRYVHGDGRHLPFASGEFEIVYSNSVIEHVGGREQQRAFADEIRRVGRRFYVQTPNRGFPIEPHMLALGTHWLPRRWQPTMMRWSSVWGIVNRPSPERIEAELAAINLLAYDEFRGLFPGARIERERVLGLTKSLIAVGEGTFRNG